MSVLHTKLFQHSSQTRVHCERKQTNERLSFMFIEDVIYIAKDGTFHNHQ
jgi:hypothetical protein